MDSLFISTGVVTLAEMGDKTQLLAFILAARFKKPIPIILGILAATVINHGLAGALGAWITSMVQPEVLRWILGASFLGMAAWTLIPDKIEEEETQVAKHFGVFGATFITFFLAEMGDKTQIATVMLAAEYKQWAWVVMGTTLGMMVANAPVVWFGERITRLVPLHWVHRISALVFVVLGALIVWGQEAPPTQPHEAQKEAVQSTEGSTVSALPESASALTEPKSSEPAQIKP